MTEATQPGAPKGAEAPKKVKPFPDPEIPESVDKSGENNDDTKRALSPREQQIADMEAKIDAQRKDDLMKDAREFQELMGGEPDPGTIGTAPIEEEVPKNQELPEKLKNDPLADFIVMEGGKPMLRMKVDGEEKSIPLETARAQLQKQVAGDARLQEAAQRNKYLDEREAQLKKQEEELRKKLEQAVSPPPNPSGADVSDQDLTEEAHQVVSSLFTGTEDEAVEKLTKLLNKTRQANTPRIDPQELAQQAAKAAREQLASEAAEKAAVQRQKDIVEGFKKFREDFADIADDDSLFRYADGVADKLARDNPDWTPAQVMTEAGKKTREWVKSLKGETTSEQDPQPENDRHGRKQNLTPMPRSASVQASVAPESEEAETPQSMMAEIRRQRGQA